jgi:phosphoribosylformylglycinamidine synthase
VCSSDLCESALLEGALLHNLSQTFICKNVNIKPASSSAAITQGLENRAYKIPIAHGEGRFYAPDNMLQSIQDNDQVIFQYCDEQGNINPENNPNGALMNIAGITNKNKNVFGMMPHPERAADSELANTDGKFIFESLLQFC